MQGLRLPSGGTAAQSAAGASPRCLQHGPRLPACRRGRSVCVHAADEASSSAPPRPNTKFSRSDIKRIKQRGPHLTDIVHTHVAQVEDKEKKGLMVDVTLNWLPSEVLGEVGYADEPDWQTLPQMPFMQFYQGLRERNWTSKYYKEDSEPWDIKFFQDSGRFMRPSYPGYRALLTTKSGQQWVNLPEPGLDVFLRDYRAAGTAGGIWRPKRLPEVPVALYQYGYNQVFEQLFQAYEQKLPNKALREMDVKGYVDRKSYSYEAPAESLLSVSHHLTPQETSLHWFWEGLPRYLFYTFAFSFTGICILIGLFRPKKAMPQDPIQAMEFAQSKGKARKDGTTSVTLKDVAGLETIKSELEDIVRFLKQPQAYIKGAKPPKGVLFEGPPGTGKTLIAKAVAGEASVPFYQMSGSEFVEAIVGVGAARIRDLFKRARVNAPCIVFVDEIDALGIKRAEAGVKTNEEREQTLNQLLTEMDGFTPGVGVVFIAATNRADLLDDALMRPGRFDRKVTLLKPNVEARAAILRVHARKHPLVTNGPDAVDLDQLARDLPGLSGAELANVLNEAALEAVRNEHTALTRSDVYNAKDRILEGVRRPGLPDGMPVKRALAVHEVGKAIVATELRRRSLSAGVVPHIEAVERVSVVARGRDWTRTVFYRGNDEDYTMATRSRMLQRLRVTMAGRAAEDLIYGIEESTTYARQDLRSAIRMAEKMVANYGLGDDGVISAYAPAPDSLEFMQRSFEIGVDNIDQDLFGRGIRGGMFQPSDRNLSRMLNACHGLIRDASGEARDILVEHRAALLTAVDRLSGEAEQITGEELGAIMDASPSGTAAEAAAPNKNTNGESVPRGVGSGK